MLTLSLAIIAWAILGARSKQEVQQFGFALAFDHPERVAVCLFVVWLWSVVRYLQFGYELLSELRNDLFEDIDSEETRLLIKTATQRARSLARVGKLIGPGASNVRITLRAEPYMIPGDGSYRFRRLESDGGEVYELGMSLEWTDELSKQKRQTKHYLLKLTRRQKRIIALRAYINAFLKLPAVGDHLVPLLVAAAALVFAVKIAVAAANATDEKASANTTSTIQTSSMSGVTLGSLSWDSWPSSVRSTALLPLQAIREDAALRSSHVTCEDRTNATASHTADGEASTSMIASSPECLGGCTVPSPSIHGRQHD